MRRKLTLNTWTLSVSFTLTRLIFWVLNPIMERKIEYLKSAELFVPLNQENTLRTDPSFTISGHNTAWRSRSNSKCSRPYEICSKALISLFRHKSTTPPPHKTTQSPISKHLPQSSQNPASVSCSCSLKIPYSHHVVNRSYLVLAVIWRIRKFVPLTRSCQRKQSRPWIAGWQQLHRLQRSSGRILAGWRSGRQFGLHYILCQWLEMTTQICLKLTQ